MKTRKKLSSWIKAAQLGDAKTLLKLFIKDVYGEKKALAIEKTSALGAIPAKLMERFCILTESCIGFDMSQSVKSIKHPTLVLGAKGDKLITSDNQVKLSESLKNGRLRLYGENFSHSLIDEKPMT